MTTKEDLIDSLTKDVLDLENVVNNYYGNKRKSKVILKLLKFGKITNKFLPYIIGSTLTSYALDAMDYSFLENNSVAEYAMVQETMLSSGDRIIKESYEKNYATAFLYSTGWIKGQYDLYERTVYTFNFDELATMDFYEVLKMNKEELCSMFIVTNIETIRKSNLSEDDYLYENNTVMITNVYESEENFYMRDKYWYETFLAYLVCLVWSFIMGRVIDKVIIRNKIKNKLGVYEEKYKVIEEANIDDYKRILNLKKENLSLLGINVESEKKKKKVYHD